MIHIYTGLGGVLAIFAIRAIDAGDFSRAFLLIFIASVIDYTDGPLARSVDSARALPMVDGSKLDTAIDFSVNVITPIYLLIGAERLPDPEWLWCALSLLPSLYRFANVNPHRKEGFFLGLPPIFVFPAFYVFFLPSIAPVLIIAYGILCFLPVGYIHPNEFRRWKMLTMTPIALWWVLYLGMTQDWFKWNTAIATLSALALFTYFGLSIVSFVMYCRGSA
jgi:phosphatidylcholine synthase